MTGTHPPEVPAHVRAVLTGPTSARVEWDAPWFAGTSPVTLYEVTAHDVAGGPDVVVNAAASATTCAVGPLVPGHTFRFTVVAVNDVGCSEPSPPSPPLLVAFSAVDHATEELREGLHAASHRLRDAFSEQRLRPDAAAERSARAEFREATQSPDDEYEALRDFRRDEQTNWVPPPSE